MTLKEKQLYEMIDQIQQELYTSKNLRESEVFLNASFKEKNLKYEKMIDMLRKVIENLEKNSVFEKLQIMQIVASVTDYSFSCYMLRYNDCNTVISIIGNAHVSGVETKSDLEWQGISGFLQSQLHYEIVEEDDLVKESNAATGLLNISRIVQEEESNAANALLGLMDT